jgi:hypothetical protein
MTMIKTLATAASVAALALAAPAVAAPYTPPSQTGTATVRLYDAITLDKVDDIVIREATYAGGSSIALAADDTTDCASVAGLSCTGSPTAGEFTIRGDNGSDMSVTLGSVDFDPVTKVLTLRNGTDTLDLTLDWSGMTQDSDPLTSDGLNTFSLTGTGSAQTIMLYGDLEVKAAADAANGVYANTFTLTADYK